MGYYGKPAVTQDNVPLLYSSFTKILSKQRYIHTQITNITSTGKATIVSQNSRSFMLVKSYSWCSDHFFLQQPSLHAFTGYAITCILLLIIKAWNGLLGSFDDWSAHLKEYLQSVWSEARGNELYVKGYLLMCM